MATDRNRRRDLTVKMRHKDSGLAFYLREQNGKDRRRAKVEVRRQAEERE